MEDITELPEEFRPPEWLTDVIPRKSPYVPQMGDDVMYFKQGHELYLLAAKKRNVYHVDLRKNQPWHANPNLRVSNVLTWIKIRQSTLQVYITEYMKVVWSYVPGIFIFFIFYIKLMLEFLVPKNINSPQMYVSGTFLQLAEN